MAGAIDVLRELQAEDTGLERAVTRIREIDRDLADRSGIEAARAERLARAEALRTIESEQRDLELDVASRRTTATDVERRLYSGRVTIASELNSLRQDLEQKQRQLAEREERLLAVLEAADEAGAALREADADLRQKVAERKALEAALSAERAERLNAARSCEAGRQRLRGQADAAALHTYDGLRRKLGGVAVAEVRSGTCQACRVVLTAGIEQRARQGAALVLCQNCGRILFTS
ncbi:MAG: C4-type zinc ribbon domain-containing protein [Chloroflexota bacterium]